MPSLLPARATPPSASQGSAHFAGESASPHLWKLAAADWSPEVQTGGKLLHDNTGFKHHGTFINLNPVTARVIGGNPRAPGYVVNYAVAGEDGHILVPTILTQSIDPRPFTILAWAKTDNTTSGRFSIFCNSESSGSPSVYAEVKQQAGTSYRLRLFSSGTNDNGGDTFTLDLEWHRYAWIWQSDDTTRYFRDGVSVGVSSLVFGSASGLQNAIGGIPASLGIFHFLGRLGNVRLYNRAVTDAEIATDYLDSAALLRLRRRRIRTAPAGVTVTVSGTTTTGIDEDDMTGAPAETTILALTGDTWVAAGASFDAQRAAIRDGVSRILPVTPEATGWDAEVRDTALVGAVARTDDITVTITWATAQTTNYDITAQETIEVTVPASALVTSLIAVVGTPTFTVDAVGALTLAQGVIAGVGAVSGQGLVTSFGQGISAGVATVTGQGAARVQSQGEITGLATVTGQSQAFMFAQGETTGAAVVLGETTAVTFSQGQVIGVGTVAGEGLATVKTQGEITGAATVVAQGVTGILGAGSIAGLATVDGQGTANLFMQGVIESQALVIGQARATAFSQGAIDGVAGVIGLNPAAPPVVFGQGEIFAGTLGPLQQGVILGVAAVFGVGISLQGILGVIEGVATVTALPRARTHVQGKIAGLSSAEATAFVTAASQGTIQGAATVAGQSQVLALTTGGI